MNLAILEEVECTIFESIYSCGILSICILSSSASASSRVQLYAAFHSRLLQHSSPQRSYLISSVCCCNKRSVSHTICCVRSALTAASTRSALVAGQRHGARLQAWPMSLISKLLNLRSSTIPLRQKEANLKP